MRTLSVVFVSLLFLTGCAHMSRDEVLAARTLVIAKCPVLKSYSPEQQKKAAEELKAMGVDSEIARMMVDYSKMRDACRAITRKYK